MAAGEQTIDQQVRDFLKENFIFGEGWSDLSGDDSLTETGVLDSMGVLELVMFMEERFGVKVPDEDMLPENLDSLNRIVAYIERRLGELKPA